MSLRLATRRLAAFFALVAMLAASLVPALSHAFVPGQATKWVEVCSSTGPLMVEVPADGPGFPKAPKASDFDHCPFCSAQPAPVAILPPVVAVQVLAPAPAPVPPLLLHAPRPLFAWSAAQPRAPPLAP